MRPNETPDSFFIPPASVRQSQAVGQIVKLVFRICLEDEDGVQTQEVERMWVNVRRGLVDSQYLSELDNDPYCTKDIQAGMAVVFEQRHVIQIYESAAYPFHRADSRWQGARR